jgi:DNA-binding NtrC family response regulator
MGPRNDNWPSNVLELRNTIERAMILEKATLTRPASLPVDGRAGIYSQPAATAASVGEWMSLSGQERRLLIQALGRAVGNQRRAAQLHITRDTLRYRMKKFHRD